MFGNLLVFGGVLTEKRSVSLDDVEYIVKVVGGGRGSSLSLDFELPKSKTYASIKAVSHLTLPVSVVHYCRQGQAGLLNNLVESLRLLIG